MAEARFYGSTDDEFFSLYRPTSGLAESINVVAGYTKGGVQKISREVVVTATELRALADWIDNFWDETPPQNLASGLIRFIYSHREHIGEGYYNIEFDGVSILQVYEQLGTSNTFRANEVRALLK